MEGVEAVLTLVIREERAIESSSMIEGGKSGRESNKQKLIIFWEMNEMNLNQHQISKIFGDKVNPINIWRLEVKRLYYSIYVSKFSAKKKT